MLSVSLLLTAMLALSFSSVSASTSELIISEYGEGSSFNKYVEIYNGTGASVNLADYEIWRVSNGGTWPEATISLSGSLADGDVYVVANPSASSTILAVADLTSGNISHNGNDAVGLAKNSTLIDAVGEDGPDVGAWDVAGVTGATQNRVLVRKDTVCAPNTDWDASRGTNTSDSEWLVQANEDWSDIGTHTANCTTSATTVLNEEFDYAEDGVTAAFTITDTNNNSETFFSDGSFDYFGVWDADGDGGEDFNGNTAPSNPNTYTGFNDNQVIISDIDGEGAQEPLTMTWSGLNIAGLSNLRFVGDFATLPDQGALDPNDFVLVEYQIDGGGYQNLLAFETADSSTFNQLTFLEDIDFDGIGEGVALSATAQTFEKLIAGTGTTLDLRITIDVDAGFEDVAFDSFIIDDQGTSDTTPPSIAALDPADDTPNVPASLNTLTATFDELVQAGTGNIFLYEVDGNGPGSDRQFMFDEIGRAHV